jgi:hypothetical protein
MNVTSAVHFQDMEVKVDVEVAKVSSGAEYMQIRFKTSEGSVDLSFFFWKKTACILTLSQLQAEIAKAIKKLT